MFGNNQRKQFEKLFQPHLDAAYNLARHLCGNAYDAEDIVQEAYMRAYRAYGNYTDDNARAWILKITRNTCHSWMRKYSINMNVCFDEQVHGTNADDLSPDSVFQSPAQSAICGSNQQRVRQAIGMLPIEFREVIILRELEGLGYHEIEQVLGIPIGTVMSRLSRARKRLRELLANVDGPEAS